MALSEADRIKMLETIASDEELKATMRLRAIEELGRIEMRKALAEGRQQQEDLPVDTAPDPMEDLDELEAVRQRRARRQRASGRAAR